MKLEPNINTIFKNKLTKTLSLCGGERNVVTYPVHFSRPYPAGFQRVFTGAWRLAGEQKTLFYIPTVQKEGIPVLLTTIRPSRRLKNPQTFCCFMCSTSPEWVFHFHAAMFLLLSHWREESMWAFKWLLGSRETHLPTGGAVQCIVRLTFPSNFCPIWSTS